MEWIELHARFMKEFSGEELQRKLDMFNKAFVLYQQSSQSDLSFSQAYSLAGGETNLKKIRESVQKMKRQSSFYKFGESAMIIASVTLLLGLLPLVTESIAVSIEANSHEQNTALTALLTTMLGLPDPQQQFLLKLAVLIVPIIFCACCMRTSVGSTGGMWVGLDIGFLSLCFQPGLSCAFGRTTLQDSMGWMEFFVFLLVFLTSRYFNAIRFDRNLYNLLKKEKRVRTNFLRMFPMLTIYAIERSLQDVWDVTGNETDSQLADVKIGKSRLGTEEFAQIDYVPMPQPLSTAAAEGETLHSTVNEFIGVKFDCQQHTS